MKTKCQKDDEFYARVIITLKLKAKRSIRDVNGGLNGSLKKGIFRKNANMSMNLMDMRPCK